MQSHLGIGLIGPGRVGSAALERLTEAPWRHELALIGLADRERTIVSGMPLPIENWRTLRELPTAAAASGSHIQHLIDALREFKRGGKQAVLVDTSTARENFGYYETALDFGVHVLTACSGSLLAKGPEGFQKLKEASRSSGARLLYDACAGAGMGFPRFVREHVVGGDHILEMGGVLGMAPSFLLNLFMPGFLSPRGADMSFSEIVKLAVNLGLTESPDPRLDLSGRDVANQLALLAWEQGMMLNVADIQVEPILRLPSGVMTLDEVLAQIESQDENFSDRRTVARGRSQVLRYVFRLKGREAWVRVLSVGPRNPAYALTGSDNLLWLRKRSSSPRRVFRGAGAGPSWTGFRIQCEIAALLGLL